jgi:hypothetical protein
MTAPTGRPKGRPKGAKTAAHAYAFRKLAKLAPNSARERLRRAIIVTGGSYIATAVVIGYSPASTKEIQRWIAKWNLEDEVREAKRRGATRNRAGKLTNKSSAIRKTNASIVRDAKRKLEKLAKIRELLQT